MLRLRHYGAPEMKLCWTIRFYNAAFMEKRRMVITFVRKANRIRSVILVFAGLAAMAAASVHLRADEPYARNRDYDLQHSKIALRFDIEQKKVIGDVTHTLAILHDATPTIAFDSVGLTIQSVTVNKAPAKFETTA